MYFVRRNRTELTPENLKHLENVFRENLAKDKEEFTLAEFKKIVPSKNVSAISFIRHTIFKHVHFTMIVFTNFTKISHLQACRKICTCQMKELCFSLILHCHDLTSIF